MILEIDTNYFTNILESNFDTSVEIQAKTIGNQSVKLKINIEILSKSSI